MRLLLGVPMEARVEHGDGGDDEADDGCYDHGRRSASGNGASG